MADLPALLTTLMSQLQAPLELMIDAYAHHHLWGSSVDDHRGRLMADWITDSGLVCLNTGAPTYIFS